MQALNFGGEVGRRRVKIDGKRRAAAVAKHPAKPGTDGKEIACQGLPERYRAKHDGGGIIRSREHEGKLLVKRHLLFVQKTNARSREIANFDGDGRRMGIFAQRNDGGARSESGARRAALIGGFVGCRLRRGRRDDLNKLLCREIHDGVRLGAGRGP